MQTKPYPATRGNDTIADKELSCNLPFNKASLAMLGRLGTPLSS
jgi:hypothetical protein